MKILQTHIVPAGVSDIRFSDYARSVFTVIPSRKGVEKAIKKGELRINGKPAETGRWIRPGMKIELIDLETRAPKPYRMQLDIVYEDDHLAVINKPAGIRVSGNRFKTIENVIQHNLSQSTEPDALQWCKPVHRLDSQTSGLLLVARTNTALINLGNQFEDRKLRKRYRAIVAGKVPAKGRIEKPVEGRDAVTEYVLVEHSRSLKTDWVSLIDLYPLTGRTHQLRIHMADEGYPVLGDKLYGMKGVVLKGQGLFLSAVELVFIHPADNKEMKVMIDQPRKFRTFLDREQRRWNKYH